MDPVTPTMTEARRVARLARPLPLVYISGPMSGGGKLPSGRSYVDNLRDGFEEYEELRDSRVCAPLCPMMHVVANLRRRYTWEEWLTIDLRFVEASDVVYRIGGAQCSPGAYAECLRAQQLERPIFTDRDELLAWCRSWIEERERAKER